jgi:hypothetical protein
MTSRRRRHSAELKASVLAECKQLGTSIAVVALVYDLNANLVHLRRIRFKDPVSGKTLVFLINKYDSSAVDHRCTVQEPLAGGVILQMDQAVFAHQAISRHQRERGEDANLVRRVHLRADRHRQEGTSTLYLALHMVTDSFRLGPREKIDFMRFAARAIGSRITILR